MGRRTGAVVLTLIVAACGGESVTSTTQRPVPPTTIVAPSTTVTVPTTSSTTTEPPETTTTTRPVVAPTFESVAALRIDAGDLWAIPVLDDEAIVVSTETAGTIALVTVERDLSGARSTVVLPVGGGVIADHKHVVQGGIHYVAYSVRSADALHLVAVGSDGTVLNEVVVSTEAPTNDMFLFGDGERLYVGKFAPGEGHEITVFDSDLVEVDRYRIGGGPDTHANGAVALVVDRVVHLVAPDTLAPGENDRYQVLRFGLDGSTVAPATEIMRRPGLSIVSGLVRDPVTGVFLLLYGEDPGGDATGGDIRMASFDGDWRLLDDVALVEGANHRPHGLLVGDDLYVGYDTQDLTARVLLLRRTTG